MNLRVHYDPECDAIGADYEQPHRATYELATVGMVMIDLPNEDSYEAVGLEVFAISAWLPLGKRGYCAKTDTLTIGHGVETATVVAENGDLVAYWAPDEYDPDDLSPIAVDLRNASKHLVPVMEAMSQPAVNVSAD